MSAYLDTHKSWGDRNGGVSSPKLIDRLGVLAGNTAEEIASVRAQVERAFPGDSAADTTARDEIGHMLFDPLVEVYAHADPLVGRAA